MQRGYGGMGIERSTCRRWLTVYLSYKWLIYLTISAAWSAMTANEAPNPVPTPSVHRPSTPQRNHINNYFLYGKAKMLL